VARVAADAVVPPSGTERPALGTQTTDPLFGPCVQRVSDHVGHANNMAVHAGARAQAFNADGSVVLLRSGQVLRLADKALVGQFPIVDSGWVWSDTDAQVAYAIRGNALVRYNFVAATESVVQRFARYVRLLGESGLALPSRQKHWALGGELPQTGEDAAGKELFVWDENTQATTPAVVIPPDAVGRVLSPRWLQAVPSGGGWVVAWGPGTRPFSGVELYNEQGRRQRQILAETPVCDVALDATMTSWLVCAQAAEKQGAFEFAISKHALGATVSPPVVLLSMSMEHAVEISCAAHGTDTCVMGVTGGHPQTPFAGEVTAFSLQSSLTHTAVWRLAHHFSASSAVTSQTAVACPIEPSAVMPHATLDRTARRVLFGSNWATHCFAELYMIDFR
jgi:hypothetical protein